MAESRYCPKCQKTMSDVKFYQYKNGEKCELCKSCLTMHINNYEEDTFLWLLEKFDVPYAPAEWKSKREKEFEKAYNKVLTQGLTPDKAKAAAYNMTKGNSVVFGKYLAQMRLKNWKDFTWADTEKLKQEKEEKAKLFGVSIENKAQEMKEAFERGEISEAEYMTYNDYDPAMEAPPTLEEDYLAAGGSDAPTSSAYPVNDHPFEQLPEMDVASELTDEDKMYLAMKWGRLYTAADWVALEELYKQFMDSFTIQGAARLDTLKKICKTSLKMDQAIDCGDIESYQKLSRVYDALMKSGKFTEAQRKEEKSDDFDCIGQIVKFAESKKGGGKIARHKIDTPLDVIDQTINKLKQYYVDLIKNDANIGQQIENYIKKKEAIEQQKLDEEKAKAQGLEHYMIKDEDFIDSKLQEEYQKQYDEEYLESLSEEGDYE